MSGVVVHVTEDLFHLDDTTAVVAVHPPYLFDAVHPGQVVEVVGSVRHTAATGDRYISATALHRHEDPLHPLVRVLETIHLYKTVYTQPLPEDGWDDTAMTAGKAGDNDNGDDDDSDDDDAAFAAAVEAEEEAAAAERPFAFVASQAAPAVSAVPAPPSPFASSQPGSLGARYSQDFGAGPLSALARAVDTHLSAMAGAGDTLAGLAVAFADATPAALRDALGQVPCCRCFAWVLILLPRATAPSSSWSLAATSTQTPSAISHCNYSCFEKKFTNTKAAAAGGGG